MWCFGISRRSRGSSSGVSGAWLWRGGTEWWFSAQPKEIPVKDRRRGGGAGEDDLVDWEEVGETTLDEENQRASPPDHYPDFVDLWSRDGPGGFGTGGRFGFRRISRGSGRGRRFSGSGGSHQGIRQGLGGGGGGSRGSYLKAS